jgi:hypothetical protein
LQPLNVNCDKQVVAQHFAFDTSCQQLQGYIVSNAAIAKHSGFEASGQPLNDKLEKQAIAKHSAFDKCRQPQHPLTSWVCNQLITIQFCAKRATADIQQ